LKKSANIRNHAEYPEKEGRIDIFPEIHDGNAIGIVIIGNPNGLRYLARLLYYLAEYDQENSRAPSDTREHIHLHVGMQLGHYSCEVELCRADAKGTGELPDYMDEKPNK
jgi:hypothetical protein